LTGFFSSAGGAIVELILWGLLVEDAGLTKAKGCSVAEGVGLLEEKRRGTM
jgi:hypothetical protein